MSEDCFQVREESNVIIGKNSIYYKDWHVLGIERVKELLNEN